VPSGVWAVNSNRCTSYVFHINDRQCFIRGDWTRKSRDYRRRARRMRTLD